MLWQDIPFDDGDIAVEVSEDAGSEQSGNAGPENDRRSA
ncbi:hypothetical protein L842_4196 [Mycobacterium intracellulare MIN_052511_1280]|nr:hypothetical protein L842_4196 [Mycobacterium intracellulare MIN_052511_1280]